MRGLYCGSLERKYLHSYITESLWYAVTESEKALDIHLAHAVMLASMYGNPDANLGEGNDQVHELYIRAIRNIPYIRVGSGMKRSETDSLVEEWRRMNAAVSQEKEST